MDQINLPYVVNTKWYYLIGYNFPIIVILVFIFVILSESVLTIQYGANLAMYLVGLISIYVIMFICESLSSTKETSNGIISRTNNLCNVFNSRGILSLKSGIFNKTFAYVTYIVVVIMHAVMSPVFQGTYGVHTFHSLLMLPSFYVVYIVVLMEGNCMNKPALMSSLSLGLFIGLIVCMFLYDMNTKDGCQIED